MRAWSLSLLAILAILVGLGCGKVNVESDASDTDAVTGDATSADSGATIDAIVVDADDASCNSDELCLESAPSGWTGPVAVGDGSCPSAYPSADDVVHRGLNAAPASCSCGCVVNGVSCELHADGVRFQPSGSCDTPPNDDATLTASVSASCTSNPSTNVLPASWTDTSNVCGGGTPGQSCNGGTCFAEANTFGSLCIVRDGDHLCPSGSTYSARTLHHRGFDDVRGCTTCGCSASGQACELDLEICSVGFFNVTLASNNAGSSYTLNGSDESVSLLANRITANGTCSTSGGAPRGQATPTSPVTACCRP